MADSCAWTIQQTMPKNKKNRPARLAGGGMAAPADVDACENGLFWILPALNAAAAEHNMDHLNDNQQQQTPQHDYNWCRQFLRHISAVQS